MKKKMNTKRHIRRHKINYFLDNDDNCMVSELPYLLLAQLLFTDIM